MTQIKYQITSTRFSGNLIVGLTGDILTLIENNSSCSKERIESILLFLGKGRTLKELAQWISGKVDLIPTDLSFDVFWNDYDKKVNRKRCEPIWKSLNDAERIECLMNVQKYHAFLQRNPQRSKLDPENYLKRGSYQTNWSEIRD